MKSLLTSLLLIVGSVLISFVVVEGLVRFLIPQDRLVTWIEMHDLGFMQNQPGGEFFQERDGRRAEYLLDENGLRVGEGSGTASIRESEATRVADGRKDVHSAGDVANGAGDTTQERTRRVLVLGDSFTFGLLLNESDTFVRRWEELLQMDHLMDYGLDHPLDQPAEPIQLLNAGVGGAGLADWPVWLEVHGARLQPDWVVYVMNTADIERALSKNLFVLDDESGTLQSSQRWKPRPFFRWLGRTNLYRWIQAHSEFVNRFTTFLWKSVYFEDITNDLQKETNSVPVPSQEQFSIESMYSRDLSLAMLNQMNSWCEDHNCRLLITTTGFFMEGEAGLHTQRVYQTLLQEHPPAPFADITPCLTERLQERSGKGTGTGVGTDTGAGAFRLTSPLTSPLASPLASIRIPGDSHPNEQGAAIIARCLHREVSPALMSNPINPNPNPKH